MPTTYHSLFFLSTKYQILFGEEMGWLKISLLAKNKQTKTTTTKKTQNYRLKVESLVPRTTNQDSHAVSQPLQEWNSKPINLKLSGQY